MGCRFMAVFFYRRAYIHLDIGAESKGLRVRERPNGGIDQVNRSSESSFQRTQQINCMMCHCQKTHFRWSFPKLPKKSSMTDKIFHPAGLL